MKTYATLHQLRLVGKGWEIRRYLQDALRQTARNVRLTDYLEGNPSRGVRSKHASRAQ
ncbi:Z-ring formation inhibitor MciZ [Paenibacillus filicis]|uniref:Z-ring formation inhibitor MciZ n=1 Tax=Paenibacillus gyeongsangnamensis TaxID=3388067 RepID=A0ABT4Q7L8_9BACL|nr:Z-ring formation inhibitor MciZ [Paenibacillus filicis]MCZ8512854.1 Z-ring formation inhibitor MciZ [Paenibacillus filicis]